MVDGVYDKPPLKDFSDSQHRSHAWHANAHKNTGFIARIMINFCSFKHRGIDRLASGCNTNALVLDLGAGTAGYGAWALKKNNSLRIVSVDWSLEALKTNPHALIPRVCADLHFLPFKSEIADALYSIDTLGHVARVEQALDEILRVCKDSGRLFLHSECNDYQMRWPDRVLIRRNKQDLLAQNDGHFFLRPAASFYELLHRRFLVKSFFSPAGLAGWLLGYPEKYTMAFAQANIQFFAGLTTIFAAIKRNPITGPLLRIVNAFSNRVELYFGIGRGGSCFAECQKPGTSL